MEIDLASVKARICLGAAGLARSAGRTSTCLPVAERNRAARDSSLSARRAVMTRLVPAEANSSARASPIPALAPVTRAHLPPQRGENTVFGFIRGQPPRKKIQKPSEHTKAAREQGEKLSKRANYRGWMKTRRRSKKWETVSWLAWCAAGVETQGSGGAFLRV